jgi:hypothetical protein
MSPKAGGTPQAGDGPDRPRTQVQVHAVIQIGQRATTPDDRLEII